MTQQPQTTPPGGRFRRNLAYARARYREGGARLVLRQGWAKVRRVSTGRSANRRSQVLEPLTDEQVQELKGTFAPKWYAHAYGLSGADRGGGKELEHYLRIGRAHGLSINPEEHAAAGQDATPLHGGLADLVREDFDPDWYTTHYPEVGILLSRGSIVTPLWHYVTEGALTGNSPNDWFDEQWYLRTYVDIALAKSLGGVPCGFVHYLTFGRAERRSASSEARPSFELYEGLTNPVGFQRLKEMERALTPFNFRIYPATGRPRINFLLPTFDKHLMFGGYIAGLNFLDQLIKRGWTVRILISNDTRATADRLRQQFKDDDLGSRVLEHADVVNLSRRSEVLDISTDDRFLSYSMWTAFHAHEFAQAVGRRFMFFIQEYEPTFHHHDSWHAVGAGMYDKPHFAIFNDPLLRRFFREQRLGVFKEGEEVGERNSVVFQHTLTVKGRPTADELAAASPRRLLFYGRPEAHAARNLFEVGVAGLRKAVAGGVFEGDWTFDGVGSLSTEAAIQLGRGKVLNLTPRLPLGDYVGALKGYGVGLSMQYAPHPGVVHFEMAACGMCVVTNTFSNRTAADLREISDNLIGIPPTPEGVAAGLADAVERSPDFEARAKGAAGPWVNDWAESFNADVMASIEGELRS